MTNLRSIAALAASLTLWAGIAAADGPVRLKPADPQPDAGALTAGLSVRYAFPGDVSDLADAATALGRDAAEGAPLIGFDYPDSAQGAHALTADKAYRVAAEITGMVRFDAAGVWRMQFHANDGLEVRIGGARVYRHDGRHGCETLGWEAEFEVPSPGWYPLTAVYFQRLGTSCLLMEWQAPGAEMGWTPNDAFAFTAR
ncbi:MAG: hypothetical protein ACJA1L_003743 [Paracoccaceae bacterium]|jgi:hypothetical protein